MNTYTILISFAGWILVAVVFECLHALVSRVAVCRIAKHYLCEGYWGFASLSVFVALNWLPEVRELFIALIVCGIHCVLTDQFGRIRPVVNQSALSPESEYPDQWTKHPEKKSKPCPIIKRTGSVSVAQKQERSSEHEHY